MSALSKTASGCPCLMKQGRSSSPISTSQSFRLICRSASGMWGNTSTIQYLLSKRQSDKNHFGPRKLCRRQQGNKYSRVVNWRWMGGGGGDHTKSQGGAFHGRRLSSNSSDGGALQRLRSDQTNTKPATDWSEHARTSKKDIKQSMRNAALNSETYQTGILPAIKVTLELGVQQSRWIHKNEDVPAERKQSRQHTKPIGPFHQKRAQRDVLRALGGRGR